MTMLMALILAAAGLDPDVDGDEPVNLTELSLPRTLASEEQSYTHPEERAGRDREESKKFILSMGIQGRWTTLFGYANRDIYYVDNPQGGLTLLFDSNLRWNDLFNAGWGTTISAELTLVQAGRTGGTGRSRGKFSSGAYISFSQDHYSGETAGDNFGNSFSTDDLSMNTYMVGGSMYQSMGDGVFLDGRLGLGAVHYAQVDAEYNFAFQPRFRGTFLEDTWNFATEFRGGTGYVFGPISLTLGMGVRMLWPPNESSSVNLDSGLLFTFDIDLGIELGF